MNEDAAVLEKLERAGVPALVAERQELVAEIKEKSALAAKLSAKILLVMMKLNVSRAQVGAFPVSVISDATTTKFDREGFERYLVDKGVSPKLLARAREKYTTHEPKKPHIRIGAGHEED